MGLDEEIDALAVRIERTIEEWDAQYDEFGDTAFDTKELEFGESLRGQ